MFTKHRMKAIPLWILMQTVTMIAFAQNTDTSSAIIHYQLKDNRADFNSSLRPLHQIAGAPEAYYSYFWEFGDGQFSFEENPKHVFKDTGLYNVRLYATNNYDDGKPPPTRPRPIKVNSKTYLAGTNNYPFFKHGGSIEMKANRMPRADEDMIVIVGYRNEKGNAPMNGSLILFYNEKLFKRTNFNLTEERTYNNVERSSLNSISAISSDMEIVPASSKVYLSGPNVTEVNEPIGYSGRRFTDLIAAKQQIFKTNNTWSFKNLQQGEEKYFFLTLHTTPEMIKDTNAVVTLTGMFIPDDATAQVEEYNLELQIVASHDPNRMMLKNSRLNYRYTGEGKALEYTVRFQNTGKGASSQISVGVAVPPMMDPKSVQILNYYPLCPLCAQATPGQSCLDTVIHKDSIYFVFKNIFLPGLKQQDMTDPDSSVGFVRYRLHFNKKLKKLPFDSRAAIVFDNHNTVYTNLSQGDFKPGNSLGLILGYNKLLKEKVDDENYWMIGGTLSPYSPYKRFLQFEIMTGYQSFPEEQVSFQQETADTVINGDQYLVVGRGLNEKQKVVKLDVVPLQVRYNFIDYLSGGLGTQVTMNGYVRSNLSEQVYLIKQGTTNIITMSKDAGHTTGWFKNVDASLFADLQLGMVRVGPILGLRFLHYFRYPQNRFFLYAAWRF